MRASILIADDHAVVRDAVRSLLAAEHKAGAMFRNDAAANSPFADVFATPSAGVTFQWRSASGGSVSYAVASGVTDPVWLKLTRTGNSFSGYYSTDGSTWAQIGGAKTVAMAASALAGLAVTAHNNAALSTAAFDNVSVNGTALALPAAPASDGTHRPVTVDALDNLVHCGANAALLTDMNIDSYLSRVQR